MPSQLRHKITKSERRWLTVLILGQIGLLLFFSWRDWSISPSPAEIRVVGLPMERVNGELSPYGPGLEREAVALFCKKYGFKQKWLTAHSWQNALEMLRSGRADLAVAPGILPESAEGPNIQSGPVYESHFPVFIHNQYRFGLDSPYSMCDKPIVLTDNPRIRESLERETRYIVCEPFVETWDDFPVQGILETVSHNLLKLVLIDGGRFKYWEPFFPELRRTHHLNRPINYQWFWRTDRSDLVEALQQFWQEYPHSPEFTDLKEKYSGFFPQRIDYFEVTYLLKKIRRDLPRYAGTIRRAARENGIDPLLIVAMIYQESQFNPEAVSKTGVRGLLQITQDTADELGVDRLDPHESIVGGCRYLKSLWERLENAGLTPWDRWFLALAAYNQGINHTRDAIRLAEKQGKNPNRWRDLKTVFPLLSYSKYYRDLEYGYSRGYEAVDYVESIRYYYYILNGLVVLARPEAEHLAPLLEARPVGWPQVSS